VQLAGIAGQSVLQFNGRKGGLTVDKAKTLRLTGLTFESAKPSQQRETALLDVSNTDIDLVDCHIQNAGGTGIRLKDSSGTIRNCRFNALAGSALFAKDCGQLMVTGNRIGQCSGGIILTGSGQTSPQISMASVISGNMVQAVKRGQGTRSGIGLYAESDCLLSGNIVENAELAGILIGWEKRQRDINCTANTIRNCRVGIGVSGDFNAGYALISLNMITGARQGAIRAMTKTKAIGPDLTRESAESYPSLAIVGNVAPRK
jgi:parallel beta-helix repeat protein